MVLRRVLATILFLLMSAGAISCESSTDVQRAAGISITPNSLSLASLGETGQLTAAAKSKSGNILTGPDATTTWTSSRPDLVSVSNSGLVPAVANGTVTVTASVADGVSATATVTVVQAAATIMLPIPADTIAAGTSTQAAASVEDAEGTATIVVDRPVKQTVPAHGTRLPKLWSERTPSTRRSWDFCPSG